MTARDDAIEAGAKALDAKWGDVVWATVVDGATIVVDAIEPIIRADERDEGEHRLRMRIHEINDQVESVVAARIEQERERLRAQVEALPCHTDDRLVNDAVERADVLALLGGESE